MTIKKRLSDEERNFFSLVSEAVVTNPFTDRRIELNMQISGLSLSHSEQKRHMQAIDETRIRVKHLEEAGRESLDQYRDVEKTILRNSFLWDFFHCFSDQFDKHIRAQVEAGAEPLQVTFADDAISYLLRKGFAHKEALRFLALNFQVRRAYYFIVEGLVGRSRSMRKLRESLWNNIFTCDIQSYNEYLWDRMEDFSTILIGETGTGKGTAASSIGQSGFIPFDEKKQRFVESFTQSFVTMNLSQFPESLIESELFGHRKGAFTGAIEDHEGIFHRCSKHGAIFLDEIGEVSAPIQIKLLKVLEERIFSPVGSHKVYRFDGRIIAATNRTFDDITNRRVMREDFYYRLCSDLITVPPLRQRIREDPGELEDLLEVIVGKILGTNAPEIMAKVRDLIIEQLGLNYEWPGNVRELAQCVRRMLLNRCYEITQYPTSKPISQLAMHIDKGDIDAQSLVKRYCQWLYQQFGTYGEVARRTHLDRRTVKKYITDCIQNENGCSKPL